jgi:ribonuclease P protein component
MTPPEAPAHGPDGPEAAKPPAVSVRLEVLKNRPDFLKAAQARRQSTQGFLVQARQRRDGEAEPALIRVGFTCSRKVGNAVARNRAKRRLREVARLVLPGLGRAGWDYVLVGRAEVTAARDFALMQDDLRRALATLHKGA